MSKFTVRRHFTTFDTVGLHGLLYSVTWIDQDQHIHKSVINLTQKVTKHYCKC